MNIVTIVLSGIALASFLTWCAIKSDERYQQKKDAALQECLAAGETQYTCKTYVLAMDAKRQASQAATSAAMASGMSAASLGIAAGKK